MGFAEFFYLFLALPFLSWALTGWARWARGEAGGKTFALCVLLAALGIDGVRLILHKVTLLPPVWWAEPVVLVLVGGFVFYALLRAWKSLERPRRRERTLEELTREATAGESV